MLLHISQILASPLGLEYKKYWALWSTCDGARTGQEGRQGRDRRPRVDWSGWGRSCRREPPRTRGRHRYRCHPGWSCLPSQFHPPPRPPHPPPPPPPPAGTRSRTRGGDGGGGRDCSVLEWQWWWWWGWWLHLEQTILQSLSLSWDILGNLVPGWPIFNTLSGELGSNEQHLNCINLDFSL